jgi:hypothetical protein
MPKRYRVVSGSDFTWEYIDDTNDPWVLLAESHERWATEQEVEAEINAMGGANRQTLRGRGGKGKPKAQNKPNPPGHKGPKD